MIIETERLRLRPLRMSDIEAILTFWGDAEVMRYCGGPGDREREIRAVVYYQKLLEEKGHAPMAVVLKKSEQVIGACGFQSAWVEGRVELIYHFAKAHWGEGYATEAIRAVMERALLEPPAPAVVAAASLDNKASLHLLEKMGFHYTGLRYFEDTGEEEPTYRYTLREA